MRFATKQFSDSSVNHNGQADAARDWIDAPSVMKRPTSHVPSEFGPNGSIKNIVDDSGSRAHR